jgi:hypothetical protein
VKGPTRGVMALSEAAAGAHPQTTARQVRTPICKAKRGAFKDTAPDVLLTAVLKSVVERSGVDPAALGDLVVRTTSAPQHLGQASHSALSTCALVGELQQPHCLLTALSPRTSLRPCGRLP